MNEQSSVILTGELLTKGKDWNLAAFGSIFEKLRTLFQDNYPVVRLIRYEGTTSYGTVIRFFGVQIPKISIIPKGMVSLAIDRNTFTVYEPLGLVNNVIWKSDLTWNWNGPSADNYPVGEFTTAVPRAWIPDGNDTVRFIVSGYAWFISDQNPDDTVRLVEYDASWPARFESIRNWLEEHIPKGIVSRIEHYGSTAIPGMPAKPVIDILVEVTSFEEARKVLLPLFNSPEYEYWWYNDHMVFIGRDRTTGIRTHHIHVLTVGHRLWEGLKFRDYLITHPDDVRRYEQLKRNLAESHAADRETYTDMKASFVREITEKALREH